jgi:hypothetical protein
MSKTSGGTGLSIMAGFSIGLLVVLLVILYSVRWNRLNTADLNFLIIATLVLAIGGTALTITTFVLVVVRRHVLAITLSAVTFGLGLILVLIGLRG